MTKAQKEFLKGLGILIYVVVTMFSLINAAFDHSLLARIAPVVLLVTPLVVAFFYLGTIKDET